MKRTATIVSLFLVSLIFLVVNATPVASMQGPDSTPPASEDGMPPFPIPSHPLPHHEPGHPARGTDYSTQVEQINAAGVAESVQLTGLDAMLADGVIDDPLQGNYRLVNLDKVMLGLYDDYDNLTTRTYELATASLNPLGGSLVPRGDHRFFDIAAGDLNGDLVDEQITAWIGNGNQILLSIGEMPGTLGRVTSGPAIVDGVVYPYTVRGYDDALWYHDGSGWKNAGGRLLSAPAIVSQGSGQSTAFAIGTDNQIYSTHLMNWALELDGVDDYVGLPDNFPSVTAFTFTAWVNWKGGDPWQRIFDFGQDANSNMFLTPSNGANMRFAITTGGGGAEQRLNSTPLLQSQWVHVAVTLDGATGVLYVNGNAVDSSNTITLTPQDVIGINTWLGRSQYVADPYFNGIIDEVAVFNRALSEVEITTIYQSGWDSMSGKILGLHLEEAFMGDGSVLADASGQGNHATLYTSQGDANKGIKQAIWQPVGPQGDWSPVEAWRGPTPELPAPAVVKRGGQLDLFRTGPDNTLRWQHSDDGATWQVWQNLGGMLASGPGAVARDDRIDVFARGVDDALWMCTYDGSWESWQRVDREGMPIGVTIASAPAVVSPAAGRLLVMVRASDDRLWQLTYNGSSWGDWQPAAGLPDNLIFASAPAMAAYGDQIHLIARSSEGKQFVWLYDGSSWGDKYEMPGLKVDEVYGLNAQTVQPPVDDAVENWLLDIDTGHFTGDGREQIVLTYRAPDGIRIEVFDIVDGFRPVKVAELESPIDEWVPKIATGDADGDGIDEIGLVYILGDRPDTYDTQE